MSSGRSARLAEMRRLTDKIRPYLASQDTFDVLINPPQVEGDGCRVWCDSEGGGMRATDLVLDPMEVKNLNRSIGSELGRPIDETHPILMGELPDDGSRVTALCPPVTRFGGATCIRKASSRLITLRDYVLSGALDGPEPPQKKVEAAPLSGHYAVLEYAARVGWNTLLVGANAAGKSTLMNGMLVDTRASDPMRRLFVIEDLAELNPAALPENVLRVQPSEALGITDADLLRVGLRVRPDGIIVAEILRPQAAYQFVNAMNRGSRGSMTTIHAESAHDGLVTLESYIEQVPGIVVSPTQIAKAIDLVAFITKLPNGKRRITEVARMIRAIARGQYDLHYYEADTRPQLLLDDNEGLAA